MCIRFFFCKQKTAYEMRISDWSSDVCSSDLKREADSFLQTGLDDLLQEADVTELQIIGMMTQHCVTHTALSPEARGYAVSIFGDACAAPTRQLSALALSGLQARLTVV